MCDNAFETDRRAAETNRRVFSISDRGFCLFFLFVFRSSVVLREFTDLRLIKNSSRSRMQNCKYFWFLVRLEKGQGQVIFTADGCVLENSSSYWVLPQLINMWKSNCYNLQYFPYAYMAQLNWIILIYLSHSK